MLIASETLLMTGRLSFCLAVGLSGPVRGRVAAESRTGRGTRSRGDRRFAPVKLHAAGPARNAPNALGRDDEFVSIGS
jgi:hypothetical protein